MRNEGIPQRDGRTAGSGLVVEAVGFEHQLAVAMTTSTDNRVVTVLSKALYSAAVCCSALIGVVVGVCFPL
jgi:hypothetical protein